MVQPDTILPSMSLGDALQSLRRTEGDMSRSMSPELQAVFEQHDAIHLLFDCGTSIQDEVAAHVWMLLATTADIGEMHRVVASHEHRTVLQGIGHWHLLGVWIACFPRILGIAFKSLRMKKRLEMNEIPKLKAKSLLEIREAHGIHL